MAKPKSILTEYRTYTLSPSFPVTLLSGDHWKISDIPSSRLHFHNCLEIGIVHAGSGTLKFCEHSLTFKPGDITVIPKNVSHTTYSTPGTHSHWSYLFLDTQKLFRDFLYNPLEDYDLSTYYLQGYKHILSKEEYPTIHNLVLHTLRELADQRPNHQLSVKGLLLSVYIELCRIQSMQNASLKYTEKYKIPDNALIIAPALDYIENHYMKPLYIDQLSTLCHWSSAHFRRVFHELIGTSPLDFINNTRVIKSCDLLRNTEESILNISEKVGFHSVSSYNRAFTKIMEMSPREYRKQSIKADISSRYAQIIKRAGWLFPEQ